MLDLDALRKEWDREADRLDREFARLLGELRETVAARVRLARDLRAIEQAGPGGEA